MRSRAAESPRRNSHQPPPRGPPDHRRYRSAIPFHSASPPLCETFNLSPGDPSLGAPEGATTTQRLRSLTAARVSRSMSRRFSVSRLSWACLPFASASRPSRGRSEIQPCRHESHALLDRLPDQLPEFPACAAAASACGSARGPYSHGGVRVDVHVATARLRRLRAARNCRAGWRFSRIDFTSVPTSTSPASKVSMMW